MRMMALSYAEGGRESADWWSIGFSVGMLAAVLIGSAVRLTRGAPEASSPIKVRDPAGGLHTVFAQEIEPNMEHSSGALPRTDMPYMRKKVVQFSYRQWLTRKVCPLRLRTISILIW